MRKREVLQIVGKTPEGRTVVQGAYKLFETYGLPLDVILICLWERNAVPDWADLMRAMRSAGRPLDRVVETVNAAISDAGYPNEFRDGLLYWIAAAAPVLEREASERAQA